MVAPWLAVRLRVQMATDRAWLQPSVVGLHTLVRPRELMEDAASQAKCGQQPVLVMPVTGERDGITCLARGRFSAARADSLCCPSYMPGTHWAFE